MKTTILCLTAITITAIICKQGGVAIALWVLYGLYKLFKED